MIINKHQSQVIRKSMVIAKINASYFHLASNGVIIFFLGTK